VNPADDEHTVLRFHFTDDIRAQFSAACVDLARLQRAAKRAEQSTRGCRDNVIERRGVRFGERGGIDLVVVRDGAVDAECDRLRFTRQTRDAQRSLDAIDVSPRCVDHFRHGRIVTRVTAAISP
jgi:hypothetical protein